MGGGRGLAGALGRRLPDGRSGSSRRRPRRCYTEARFAPGDVLVFGSESQGLPRSLLAANPDRCLRIPMDAKARSLNLAVSVAVAAYESAAAMRAGTGTRCDTESNSRESGTSVARRELNVKPSRGRCSAPGRSRRAWGLLEKPPSTMPGGAVDTAAFFVQWTACFSLPRAIRFQDRKDQLNVRYLDTGAALPLGCRLVGHARGLRRGND